MNTRIKQSFVLAATVIVCLFSVATEAQRSRNPPPPTTPTPPNLQGQEEGIPRKIIGYVDYMDPETGYINGWACAVGESQPITVMIHQPPIFAFPVQANLPNEPIINSEQYCGAGGNHRFEVPARNWKPYMENFLYTKVALAGIFATNNYGPITNTEGLARFPGSNAYYAPLQKNPDYGFLLAPWFGEWNAGNAAFVAKFWQAAGTADVQLRMAQYYELARNPQYRSSVEQYVLPAILGELQAIGYSVNDAVAEMARTLDLNTHLIINMIEMLHHVNDPVTVLVGTSGMTSAFLAALGIYSSWHTGQMIGHYVYDYNATAIARFIDVIADPTCSTCFLTVSPEVLKGFWDAQTLFPVQGGINYFINLPVFGDPIFQPIGPKATPATYIATIKLIVPPLPGPGPAPGPLKTWVPTPTPATKIAQAQTACTNAGMATPTISLFRAEHDRAKAIGKTIQSLFNVPSQLHWLVDDQNCAPSGSACYYRPYQESIGNEAQMVQAYPNDAGGNGNSGNGAFVMCVH